MFANSLFLRINMQKTEKKGEKNSPDYWRPFYSFPLFFPHGIYQFPSHSTEYRKNKISYL